MSLAADNLGNRYVECSDCGLHGPHRVNSRMARAAAAAAGWARSYRRGVGEDFVCPGCRKRPVSNEETP